MHGDSPLRRLRIGRINGRRPDKTHGAVISRFSTLNLLEALTRICATGTAIETCGSRKAAHRHSHRAPRLEAYS
jgi:hypothetical protein